MRTDLLTKLKKSKIQRVKRHPEKGFSINTKGSIRHIERLGFYLVFINPNIASVIVLSRLHIMNLITIESDLI